jgi:hypothetical protein
MARSPEATAQLRLRVPEELRARLEADARQSGHSLNFEVVRRLGLHIQRDDVALAIFRDPALFSFLEAQARIIRWIERREGKSWTDPEVYEKAKQVIREYQDVVLPALAAGTSIQDAVLDASTLAFIETMGLRAEDLAARAEAGDLTEQEIEMIRRLARLRGAGQPPNSDTS